MHIYTLPTIMGIEHHSVRTNLLESGCKQNTLMGIKQTGKDKEEERDSNSKTNVLLHILGNYSLVR